MNYSQTKEFYEVVSDFEKCIGKVINIGAQGFLKEDKSLWKLQVYYCDGNINNAFKIFLMGVSLGKII